MKVAERGRARAIAAAITLGLMGSGAVGAACSSDPTGFPSTPDAGQDVTVAPEDAPSGTEAGRDAGRDALPLGDAEGNCSPVKGECDIVAQNCPDGPSGQKRECTVDVDRTSGAFVTVCADTRVTQRLPKGQACCPNAPGGDPCAPGLECIGNACVGDAAPTARCSPHCCLGSNGLCGQSDPEGYGGVCDYNITASGPDGSVSLYNACSYSSRCNFFGVKPCPSGFTCVPEDNLGAAKCYSIFNPDGSALGLNEGQPCSSANSCADGLLCVGTADAGSRCRMLCLESGGNPPTLDASALEGGAFRGGCVAGKSCSIQFVSGEGGLPAWLNACAAPDGG